MLVAKKAEPVDPLSIGCTEGLVLWPSMSDKAQIKGKRHVGRAQLMKG
jgi:hypothetical protein